jgi:hypothetical protein
MEIFDAISPLFALSGFFVGLLVGLTGVGGGSLMTPLRSPPVVYEGAAALGRRGIEGLSRLRS